MATKVNDLPEFAESAGFRTIVGAYPGKEDEATRIASMLEEQYPDSSASSICRGVDTALATQQRGTVKAFVSFKMTAQGKRAAMALAESLRALTAGRIELTSALDFTPGREWPAQIRRAVEEANWFILMLPDRSKDYDWMLFETGMFRAQMTIVDRLICVHHPLIPIVDQIREFQSVAATEEDLKGLLVDLTVKANAIPGMQALNPEGESLVGGLAKNIADSIDPPMRDRTYHGRVLTLRIEHADQCDPEVLGTATIAHCHRVERIFDQAECPDTFGELVRDLVNLKQPDQWVTDLCEAIRRAATGRTVKPIQSTFKGAELGRVFRPILHATDRVEKGELGETFHIIFLEDDRVMSRLGVPKSVGILASLVRQAFRFQWEILNQFNRDDLTEEDLKAVEEAICSLESDFQASGFTPEDVQQMIGSQFELTDQARLTEMHQHWNTLRQEGGKGRLDRAIELGDPEEVRAILAGLSDLANEYLTILTKEFHEVSKKSSH